MPFLLGHIAYFLGEFHRLVEVIEEEASEDIQKMAGITDEEEIRETSVFKISFGRLPWLLVGFVGQLVAALVLSQFETSLKVFYLHS